MWRGPTGGSASRRSCGTSGGGGSGWSASCCWRWTGAGGLPRRQYSSLIRPPNPNSSNLLLPWPPVNGGDQRGVSHLLLITVVGKADAVIDVLVLDPGKSGYVGAPLRRVAAGKVVHLAGEFTVSYSLGRLVGTD